MNSSSRKPSPFKILLLIIIIITILIEMFLFGYRTIRKGKCTETVTAVVVDEVITHSRSRHGRGKHTTAHYSTVSYYHAPVFSYSYNGVEYTVTSNEGSDPPRYKIGDSTELMIDPSNPEYFYDPSSNVTLVLSIVFGAIGVVSSGISLVLILKKY